MPYTGIHRIYRKDSHTGKIAAGGIWTSKSGENPRAVAELLPDVPPPNMRAQGQTPEWFSGACGVV